MNTEIVLKPLAGNALKLSKGIFDDGKRLTRKQWAKALWGDAELTSRITRCLKTLERHGQFVACVTADPSHSSEPGVLCPLTESREICRFVNERRMSRLDGQLNSTLRVFQEELAVYPDLGPELVASMEATIAPLVMAKKMALAAAPSSTVYVSARKQKALKA